MRTNAATYQQMMADQKNALNDRYHSSYAGGNAGGDVNLHYVAQLGSFVYHPYEAGLDLTPTERDHMQYLQDYQGYMSGAAATAFESVLTDLRNLPEDCLASQLKVSTLLSHPRYSQLFKEWVALKVQYNLSMIAKVKDAKTEAMMRVLSKDMDYHRDKFASFR
jgi:hypothetical protein